MGFAVDTDMDNSTLDFVVFATREEAERAANTIKSMASNDRRFDVYETTDPANTTFADWNSETDDEINEEKHDYIITCESGIKALVRAEDAATANALWDAEVAIGNAEPRIRGMTELADEGDVRACVAAGHDYRDAE